MNMQITTLIPAFAAIVWAISVKLKDKRYFEANTLLVSAIALFINAAIVQLIISNGSCATWLHFLQMLTSATIVPLAYMYFSRQIGRKWNNATLIVCWLLTILIPIPNITILLGADKTLSNPELVKIFAINIIKGNQVVFSCNTADFVILLQALLTVIRMIPAAITLKKYGLIMSTRMISFYIWWSAAVVFICYTSIIDTQTLSSEGGSWTYFISYSTLITAIYVLFALRLDLHPIVTDEGEPVVELDKFIDAHKSLAVDLKKLISEKQVYLIPGYTAEDAATELGTNRTYFSRMMLAEFGMKFSDLINEHRVEHAKEMLLSTDKSVSEIATESGFSDSSYMNKKFKQLVGMTPNEFRATKS